MDPAQKLEEVAKVRSYLGEAESEIAKVGVIPRRLYYHKFDNLAPIPSYTTP